MFLRRFACAGALLLGAALAYAAPARAQLTEGILAPAGRLRLEVSPEFDLWGSRFDASGGTVPLQYDLEQAPLSLAPLKLNLGAALGGAAPALELGSMRAVVTRDRTRIAFGGALGVFDWLTVGATLPLVRARNEIAYDFRTTAGANVGRNPLLSGDGSVDTFLGALSSARAALATVATQHCPAAADCAALTDLLGRYTTFADGLRAAYESSPLFVTTGSSAAAALQARLASLTAEVAQRAPSAQNPGAAPLADKPLDQAGLAALLVDPAGGYDFVTPLETTDTHWALGDAEVSVAVRLLEGDVRDSAAADDRIHYVVGAQALARLPTGHQDDPSIPFDLGTGDAQTDLEGGAFSDLRWSDLGLRAEARYGVQRPTDLERRVAPRSEVFPPILTLSTVTWTPGSYLSLEAAPSWYLARELAVGATYRFWSKGADTYRYPGSTQDDAASVLAVDTEQRLHEIGLGLAFSTLETWRAGRASIPFELRLMVRRPLAGRGRDVPSGTRLEATGRVFWRLWGAEPLQAATPTS